MSFIDRKVTKDELRHVLQQQGVADDETVDFIWQIEQRKIAQRESRNAHPELHDRDVGSTADAAVGSVRG